MAKKRRSKGQRPKQAAKPSPPPTADAPEAPARQAPVRTERPLAPPAREPAFWFGFEIAWAKLAVARFVIFALLAVDAVLQISHAPRYGAGGFNVAQLSFLDDLGPGRVAFGTCQLLLAYGFVLIAFGVATRVLVPICAAIYAWLYFGSQLDSYQHHYLMVLVLAIASFVPWQRPADVEPATPVRTWAVRLLLVQLGIMYLWAAVSKMNLAWVDGRTLGLQMTGAVGSLIKSTVGFKVVAVLVIAVELVLAATVWARPAWRLAAPLGIAFHAGIIFTKLEIGLFAFLMLGIYVLVVPDRLWVSVMSGPLDALAKRLARPSWIAWGAGLALSIVIAFVVRLESAFVIAIATCVVPLGVAVYGLVRGGGTPRVAVGVAHVLAIVLWLIVDRATSVTVDYYRFWAGSQRRLGAAETAERAYRRFVEVAPGEESAHFQLGRLLITRGATDEGLAHLHEAQRLEPAKARAFVEEARYLQRQGRTAEAIEKAKQATFADPSDAQARAVLDALTGGKPKPAAPDADDAD